MFETLLRPHDVTHVPVLPSIDEATEKLKKAEIKREEKRLRQIATGAKRKRDGENVGQQDLTQDPDSTGSKRARIEDEDSAPRLDESEPPSIDADPSRDLFMSSQPIPSAVNPALAAKVSVSKALSEVRGHTSYLTFACLLSSAPTSAEAPQILLDNPEDVLNLAKDHLIKVCSDHIWP